MAGERADGVGRGGRKQITSKAELERAAFELFDRCGFEATTVDDIVRAAGIGRRTFFRYFPSKNDLAWGDFDAHLATMRAQFDACPADMPVMQALREVVVAFNDIPETEVPRHRRRMRLILTVPALQAHSTLRYADWRNVVAEFVGSRMNQPPDALLPRAIAHAALGTAIAAYQTWLDDPAAQLSPLIDTAFGALSRGFNHPDRDKPAAKPPKNARRK